MKYKSAVFCEHANEVPKQICKCSNDCSCRKHMCNIKEQQDKIAKAVSEMFNKMFEL